MDLLKFKETLFILIELLRPKEIIIVNILKPKLKYLYTPMDVVLKLTVGGFAMKNKD